MNFSYGIIIAVGILVAISLGFIAADPSDIIEPRVIPVKEKPTMCTMEYAPVCGIDGKTYGNMCMLDASDVKFAHEGECGVDDPIVKPRVTPEVSKPMPEVQPKPVASLPMSLTVSIPEGSGVPGCETNDECYLPYEASIAVGGTVTWSNDDSAAHTVTSGSPADGHDGLFDSSLFMAATTYDFTFEEAGTYDYFCMVHPWMVGIIHVEESKEMMIEPEPITVNSHILPKTALVGETLIIEVEFRDDDNNIVDHVNYDITATQDGDVILSEPKSHRHPGMHPIHETSILGESEIEIKVIIQGLGHGEDITEPIGVETVMSVIPEIPMVEESESETLPMSLTISVPEGSGTPGCEETNECYLPYDVSITVGGKITWSNDDSAAHTVTSGNANAGPTGVFDSGLFMAGSTYDFTFEEAGTYDYFCMVHPWMTGLIHVS